MAIAKETINHYLFLIKKNYADFLGNQSENLFLWIPVFFGIGIISYFSLPFEPSLTLVILFAILSISSILLIIFIYRYRNPNIIPAILIFALPLMGFTISSIYTRLNQSPKINETLRKIEIYGVVDEIDFTNRGDFGTTERLILKDIKIYDGNYDDDILEFGTYRFDKNDEWVDGEYINPPKKIRINVFKNSVYNIKPGSLVRLTATLRPIMQPFLPNGYDASRNFYFKSIGATGYTSGKVEILLEPQIFHSDIIDNLRNAIAKRITEDVKSPNSEIMNMLLLGVNGVVPAKYINDIRNSSLAHLLAISGMHLSLVCGMVFVSTRFLLSRIEKIAINYNVKKIASISAIIIGFFYLILTDMPISAVRAYIMVLLVFMGILFDRIHSAMRSVAIAAMTIMIFMPNMLLNVGFQMSFAAVIAMIATYELMQRYSILKLHNKMEDSEEIPTISIRQKFTKLVFDIILYSIAAEIAISIFTIYHFNNLSVYGILANIIAIPITTFIIMPFGLIGILFVPLHLEQIFFFPVSIAVDSILIVAEFVANLPHSNYQISQISSISFGLAIISGLWFSFLSGKIRLFGIAGFVIAIILAIAIPTKKPDIIIDGNLKFLAIIEGNKLITSGEIYSRFQKSELKKEFGIKELMDGSENCTKYQCEFFVAGKKILFTKTPYYSHKYYDYENYGTYDIIIGNQNLIYAVQPVLKENLVFVDRDKVIENGTHYLYIGNSGVKIENVKDKKGNRFW